MGVADPDEDADDHGPPGTSSPRGRSFAKVATSRKMISMPAAWVLDEDQALELLAYLITSARTQVDEAAEYGPMRLITAAHRLADAMAPHASADFGALRAALDKMPPLAVPREDRDDYVERLDVLCRVLGGHLTARFASESEAQ